MGAGRVTGIRTDPETEAPMPRRHMPQGLLPCINQPQVIARRVPLFESSIVQTNSSVGTISSLIWDPENQSATTFGPLGSVPTDAVLTNVTIINSGTSSIYVGSGSAAAAAATGLEMKPGDQVTVQGYSVSSPSGSTGQIWGQTSVVGETSSTTAGMASVASVV